MNNLDNWIKRKSHHYLKP